MNGTEVVLAQRRERDVAHHDHLVVAGLEAHAQMLAGVDLEPLEEFDVHVGHAPGRLDEALARRVLADRLEQLADQALDPRLVDHA